MSKKQREIIKNKYNGLCAYSGTGLEDDWQIDHVRPIIRNWWNGTCVFNEVDKEWNMIPVQKLINHYKSSMGIEDFRDRMKTLHLRLAQLPQKPKVDRSIKRKKYLLKIAKYFDITIEKPFNGIFYFETEKLKA